MSTATLNEQKRRILSYPLAEGCHLKRSDAGRGRYFLIITKTNCLAYPYDDPLDSMSGFGATLDEIELWLNTPVEGKR